MPLTKKQKEAVESAAQHTLVIAGPGTGKTHILASRIEYLVRHEDTPPKNILALTFTKTGAQAMKERAISFLGPEGYDLTANTFHGFAASLLEEYPDVFGYRFDARQITDIERVHLVEDIFETLAREKKIQKIYSPDDPYYIKTVANTLKNIKREGFSPAEFSRAVDSWQNELDELPDEEKHSSRGPTKGQLKQEFVRRQEQIDKSKELAHVYEEYQDQLDARGFFDYEDMILRAIEGLQANEGLRHELHLQYSAVLADEYQDTSGAQNKLLFLLIGENTKTFVVGDDDQAIYRFQGATIQNFREFIDHYTPEIVTLEDSFRSPQFLIDAALRIARANPERLTKHLDLPDKVLHARGPSKDAEDVTVAAFETDEEEHAYLVQQIQELHKAGAAWGDIAVITLTNKEQEELAELLRHNGVPTTVSGDTNALEHPVVSTLFTFAEACCNPHKDEPLIFFLLHPATPIGREDVWRVLDARRHKEATFSAFRRLLREDAFSQKEQAQQTYEVIASLAEQQTTIAGAQWLKAVLEQTGLLTWILQQEEAPYSIANIRALTDEAKRVSAGNPDTRIADILRHFRNHIRLGIPLKPKLASLGATDTVQITTAHKVKGQEFQNVFITHAAHGNWSGKKRKSGMKLPPAIPEPQQNAADERRVFYVAMTRAKEKLFITYAKTYTRGFTGLGEEAREAHPALFLEELREHIPAKLMKPETEQVLRASVAATETANETQKEIISNIVQAETFALNPTALNAFLECPQKFLYEKVLRIPTVKNFALTYGEAVHLALQQYFATPEKERGAESLMKTVRSFVKTHSTLTEAENKQLLARAEESLTTYYETRLNPPEGAEPQPIYTEYTFPRNEVTYEGARITGKADKISPLEPADSQATPASNRAGPVQSVSIVDYKTNKKAPSVRQIKGKNKDQNDVKLYRQLMFYKLLSEQYERFHYEAQKFILDFVDAGTARDVPLEEDDYREFKETVKQAWESMQSLDFLNPEGEFPHCGECKYCGFAS